MYSIEINLLKDRPEYSQEAAVYSSAVDSDDKTPLFLGVAFGGAMLGLVLISLGVLSFLNQRLTAEQAELDDKLQQLAPRVKEVETLQAKTKTLTSETKALATIFNQIKPWSAMLQDLADRVPTTLQITDIEESVPGKTTTRSRNTRASTANVSPSATQTIEIKGKSLSFDDVNDFELTLRQSPFLFSEETKLMSSEREPEDRSEGVVRQINFTMKTQVNAVPADELLQALNSKGAPGLVSRINTLKEKGVIQP